ncbi:hypothetical protein DZE40_000041 [Clostridium beijerinckii]|nr:hypothetical protein [Clostridium beijerinckii]
MRVELMLISTEVESMFALYIPLKYILTRNKNYDSSKSENRKVMIQILYLVSRTFPLAFYISFFELSL